MKSLADRIYNFLKWPGRYRTSRGFGVHSPFAFDFITKVLRDRKAFYYAYPEIDAFCGKRRRDSVIDNNLFSASSYASQEARMLFRILCRFNPDQVIEVGGGHEVSRTIIERAVPTANLYRWSRENPVAIDTVRPCVIIVNYTIDINFNIVRNYLLEALKHPAGVVFFFRNMHIEINRRLWDQISMVAPFGMTFRDDVTGIYAAFRKLPRKDFDILL